MAWPIIASDPNQVTEVTVVTDEPVLCPDCGRTVAWKATRPYSILCRSCKVNVER